MYVDSGVLLKLYLPEPESEAAQQTVATAVDLTCSELLLAEFQSALSRKHREGQIDTYAAVESMAALRRHIEQGAIGFPINQHNRQRRYQYYLYWSPTNLLLCLKVHHHHDPHLLYIE